MNESMETSVEGIFACGNVVHVHDLVDWVTKESQKAGKSAAQYIKGEITDKGRKVSLKGQNGIRYIVPQHVRVENVEKEIQMMMRIDNVYSDVKFVVKGDGKTIKELKKSHVAPGEMETVKLTVDELNSGDFKNISIEIVKGV